MGDKKQKPPAGLTPEAVVDAVLTAQSLPVETRPALPGYLVAKTSG